jgi:hypothetical protein
MGGQEEMNSPLLTIIYAATLVLAILVVGFDLFVWRTV